MLRLFYLEAQFKYLLMINQRKWQETNVYIVQQHHQYQHYHNKQSFNACTSSSICPIETTQNLFHVLLYCAALQSFNWFKLQELPSLYKRGNKEAFKQYPQSRDNLPGEAFWVMSHYGMWMIYRRWQVSGTFAKVIMTKGLLLSPQPHK